MKQMNSAPAHKYADASPPPPPPSLVPKTGVRRKKADKKKNRNNGVSATPPPAPSIPQEEHTYPSPAHAVEAKIPEGASCGVVPRFVVASFHAVHSVLIFSLPFIDVVNLS
jgi:hypothetical protein